MNKELIEKMVNDTIERIIDMTDVSCQLNEPREIENRKALLDYSISLFEDGVFSLRCTRRDNERMIKA